MTRSMATGYSNAVIDSPSLMIAHWTEHSMAGIAEVINFVLILFKPDFCRFDFPNHLCCKTVKIDV